MCGTLCFLFCCEDTIQLVFQLHQERTQVCTVFVLFCFCFSATQLARQVHKERTQVVCSNKVTQERLTPRHSRNHDGPWTRECCFEVHVFVCWEWIEELEIITKDLLLRVEFLLKTDSGYPKDTGVNKPWLFLPWVSKPNLITILN